jgi:hypothetical protein
MNVQAVSKTPTACYLCGSTAPLHVSHIIPGFVFDWLRETSGTGHLRFGMVPNRRAQDATKCEMLCDVCEQAFAKWEKEFAEKVFVPMQSGDMKGVVYGPWLMKFAASVSWRALVYQKHHGGLDHIEARHPGAVDRALETWREFPLGLRSHPGVHEQHMLPFDVVIDSTHPDTPSNLNQWILRTMEIDAACNADSAFVFTKMCRFLLFGFIVMPNSRQWKATKLHVNNGTIGGKQHYRVPGPFGNYFMSRADKFRDLQRNLSPRQQEIVEKSYASNPERVAASESFQAFDADVRLFGDAAFRENEGDPS